MGWPGAGGATSHRWPVHRCLSLEDSCAFCQDPRFQISDTRSWRAWMIGLSDCWIVGFGSSPARHRSHTPQRLLARSKERGARSRATTGSRLTAHCPCRSSIMDHRSGTPTHQHAIAPTRLDACSPGARSEEQGARSKERGARSKEQGLWLKAQGSRRTAPVDHRSWIIDPARQRVSAPTRLNDYSPGARSEEQGARPQAHGSRLKAQSSP